MHENYPYIAGGLVLLLLAVGIGLYLYRRHVRLQGAEMPGKDSRSSPTGDGF
jgi:hypothetical protein